MVNISLLILWSLFSFALSVDIEYADIHLERAAFGSCNKQGKPVEISPWNAINKLNPQLWLWNGDAVYSKNETLLALEDAYETQMNDEEYLKFLRSGVMVDGVWDDHDYGLNDAGNELTEQTARQKKFLDFLKLSGSQVNDERRERKGVYRSLLFGQNNQKVKIIMLDTRTFRDLHLIPSIGASCRKIPIIGALTPMLAAFTRWFASTFGFTSTHSGDMLGEVQWKWLEKELKHDDADNDDVEPAFTIIVSSVQVLTSAPVFESWSHFPQAQERLFDLLRKTNPKGLVLLSGDVHFAEILSMNKLSDDASSLSSCDDIIEVTASGMTHSCQSSIKTKLFCNPVLYYYNKHRYSKESYYLGRNFGFLNIDWSPSNGKAPLLTVSLHDATTGEEVLQVKRSSCFLDEGDDHVTENKLSSNSEEL